MNLKNLMSLDELESHINSGYVTKRKHPNLDLWILNYTSSCQFDNIWNDVTENSRGLIINSENLVIARPWKKFKNYEEVLDKIPNLPFTLLEKMDGSLGIVTSYKGEVIVSTRGSFESEQSIWAGKLIREKYKDFQFPENVTYLFEIIYKENRIVVKYDFEDIVLIGVMDNETGDDLFIKNHSYYNSYKFPFLKSIKYDFNDLESIKSLNWNNFEGMVVTWDNGFKAKIKFSDYVRLHRILTNCNEKTIWECLMNEQSIESFIDNIPDEFYNLVKSWESILRKNFEIMEKSAMMLVDDLKSFTNNRKDFALGVNKCEVRSIRSTAFAMYHGQDYKKIIWKSLKPKLIKKEIENEK